MAGPDRRGVAVGVVSLFAGAIGCASIAGLDEDYLLGSGAGGGAASGASTTTSDIGGTGAAAGATSSGGSTSSTGTTTSGGGGSGGLPETCAVGYECVVAPPGARLVSRPDGPCAVGWNEPFVLHTGDDPGCSPCTACASPTGGGCGAITVERFSDTSCTSHLDGPIEATAGVCYPVSSGASTQAQGYLISIAVTQGACGSSDSSPELLASVGACALGDTTGGLCQGGICAPEGLDPAPEDECLLLEGFVECPQEYHFRDELYRSMTDGRQCACRCEAGGASCSAELRLFTDEGCTSGAQGYPAPGCVDVSDYLTHDGYKVTESAYQPGQCVATAAHSGSVVFGDPVTLCCAPPP